MNNDPLEAYGWILLVFVIVIAAVMVFFPWNNSSNFSWQPSVSAPNVFHIPSNAQIQDICRAQNYQNGWLDARDCGQDQVKCHKEIATIYGVVDKYTCVQAVLP